MKLIDYKTWSRHSISELFLGIGVPFYSFTVNVDIAKLYNHCRSKGLPLYFSTIYVFTKALNSVPAFLFKLRGDSVARHDCLSPSFTYPRQDDSFGIVNIDWVADESIDSFCQRCSILQQDAESGQQAYDEQGELRDDLIYYSCIPWFSFTSHTQEMSKDPNDSIPRIAWGRFELSGERRLLPLSIQVNHRLIDGIHIAKFLDAANELINALTD